MSKRKYKNSKKLIVAISLAVVSVVLLVFSAVARYSRTQEAYTKYNVANFNTVILGPNNVVSTSGKRVVRSESGIENTDGLVDVFGKTLDVDNFVPGMTMVTFTGSTEGTEFVSSSGTQRDYDFSVTNGINSTNVSKTSIKYTVRIRTTDNLPLNYTLGQKQEDESYIMYTTSSGTCVKNVDGDNPIYEYTFMKDGTEAVFSMSGGNLDLDKYTLFVEWPAEYNDLDYMKEVDTIEVFVTSTSVNYLEQSSSPYNTTPNAQGVLLLYYDQGSADSQYAHIRHFKYDVDLRSFKAIGGDSSSGYKYNFVIDNGLSKGSKSTDYENMTLSNGSIVTIDYIRTDFSFKIPFNTETRYLEFNLESVDENETYYQTTKYELKDEYLRSDTYGDSYTVNVNLTDEGTSDRNADEIWDDVVGGNINLDINDFITLSAGTSKYKLYKVFNTVISSSDHSTQYFILDAYTNNKNVLDTKEFNIIMTSNSGTIDLSTIDFLNKLSVYVDTIYEAE